MVSVWKIAAAISFGLAAQTAYPAELVVLAKVESIRMYRPSLTVERNPDGTSAVWATTSCGVFEAQLEVDQVILGKFGAAETVARTMLTEQCKGPDVDLVPSRYLVPLTPDGARFEGTPVPLYETRDDGLAAPPWIASSKQQEAMIRDVRFRPEGEPLIDVDTAARRGYPQSWLEPYDSGSPVGYFSYRKGIPYEALKQYIRDHGWIESVGD